MTHPLKGAERIKRYSRKMIFSVYNLFSKHQDNKKFPSEKRYKKKHQITIDK